MSGLLKLRIFGTTKVSGSTLRTYHIGTRGYQAPEIVWQSNEEYTNAVDIWATGIMACELLNGTNPFADSETLYKYYKGTL